MSGVLDDLCVVPFRPADAGAALTVQRAAYVTEAQRYRTPDLPPLVETLDELRADVARPDVVALTVWLGARLVGSVRGRVDGAAMEVARLSVAPDMQGRGVGRMLLTAVHTAAPDSVATTWLVTGARSADNIAFYVSAGYRVTARTRDAAGVELVRMDRSARPRMSAG